MAMLHIGVATAGPFANQGQVRIGVEIFIANVAPADDRSLIVHCKCLGVHARIDIAKPGYELQVLWLPSGIRRE